MSSIPYNYGSYIDAKVAMTDTGHVSAGKQIQSPASAGSRGLAKTTQFTNDRTQMQMRNSPIAESMVEIRNILNRIDGVNVPVQEDAGEKIANMAQNMTKDQFMSHADELGLTPEEAAEHYEKMQGGAHVQEKESAVKEDAGEDEKVVDMLRKIKQHLDNHPNMNEHPSLVALDQLADDLESGDKPADYESVSEHEDELSRLKELSGIQEDVDMDALKKWNEKYSKYRGMNGDKLPLGLYMQMAQTGVPTDGMEAGEAKQAIADQNPKLDPTDADAMAGSAEEIPGVDFDKADAPITDAMKQELADIMGVDAIGEEEITKAMKMLGISTGMESYQPFPEGDEFDIEEDEDFEEVLGPLGFPEDETELFDAEYQGRKVPLNKPMRGDTKKFKVYVKDPKTGNVKKVNFGHGGTSAKRKTMRIRKSNPKARKSFRARHNCANPGPKTKARYWSCRKW